MGLPPVLEFLVKKASLHFGHADELAALDHTVEEVDIDLIFAALFKYFFQHEIVIGSGCPNAVFYCLFYKVLCEYRHH